MAGTALFMGMQPGLAKMMGSLADESLSAKGYALGASAGKDIMESRKIGTEMQNAEAERIRKLGGITQNIAGTYGVDPRLVEAVMNGGDVTGFNVDPKVLQGVRRDTGAFMFDPTKAEGYHSGMAKLPGEQAKAAAASEIMRRLQLGQPIDDNMRALSAVQAGGQMHQPHASPAEVQMFELFKDPAMRPLVNQFLEARKQYPPMFSGTPSTGVVNSRTGQIMSPPEQKPQTMDQVIAQIVAKALAAQQGGAPAAAPTAAPPAVPAMSNEDQQALAWANANPNDPRSAKIKQRLGVR